MRTTLALDDEAMKAVRAYAKTKQFSLGKAASELIRRGARYQLGTIKLNGLTVLDANVLLALVWPRHENHGAAHAWFAKSGHRAGATNLLTQIGVLRLLTNPAVSQGAVSAVERDCVLVTF